MGWGMSDIRSYLHSKGIKFREAKRPSGTQAIFNCPKCGDKSFSINLDTGAYSCYKKNKCGISGSLYKFQKLLGDEPRKINTESEIQTIFSRPQQKLVDPDQSIKDYLSKRKIDFDKAREHFKIMKLGDNIAFRYFDYGEHIGTKFKSIKEKKFYNEKDCRPGLYNIDNCRDSDTLYMCEGELDCIALYQHTGIDAVSVPNGTGDMRWIEYCWGDLEAYKHIVLIFDTDKAGQESANKIAQRLGTFRCSNVVLPYNDINDCLIQGMKPEDLCEVIFKAKDMDQSKIQSCSTYIEEICDDLNDPERLRGLQLKSFPEFMKIIQGLRRPESTVITGQNHAGKSTVINQLMIDIIRSGEKCAVASLEMPPRRYLRWLVSQTLGPEEFLKPEIVKKKLDYISEQLYIIDIQGRVSPDEILEHFDIACRKYGCSFLFIDSLMKVNLDRKDLLGSQAEFVDRYIDLGLRNNAHTALVVHPRKGAADNDRPGKVDVGGSGHITDAVDNVWSVWRPDQQTKEELRKKLGTAPDSVLSVKKCREFGAMGDVFLGFNEQKKIIYEMKVKW